MSGLKHLKTRFIRHSFRTEQQGRNLYSGYLKHSQKMLYIWKMLYWFWSITRISLAILCSKLQASDTLTDQYSKLISDDRATVLFYSFYYMCKETESFYFIRLIQADVVHNVYPSFSADVYLKILPLACISHIGVSQLGLHWLQLT